MSGGSLTYIKPSWFFETFFSLHNLYVKEAKKINKHHLIKVTTTTTTALNWTSSVWTCKKINKIYIS